MWVSVDEVAVDTSGACTLGAAEVLAGVDLAGLAGAIRAAMPGARSAAAADAVDAIQREAVALAAMVADASAGLRLAAQQYAAADTIVRASSAAARASGSATGWPGPGHAP